MSQKDMNGMPGDPAPQAIFRVPFGRSAIAFTVPPGTVAEVIESSATTATPLPDIAAATTAALAAPYPPGSPTLRALLERAAQRARQLGRSVPRVVIGVPDLTIATPDAVFVPALLAEIRAANIPPSAVTILIATGLHRALTDAEIAQKLGASVAATYRVVNHSADNPAEVVSLGLAPSGLPLSIHRLVVEADLVVTTGTVEPHQFAGFNGGRTTLGVGLAGAETIAAMHRTSYLTDPNVVAGNLDGNPFHLAMETLASRAGLAFILNAVNDSAGNPILIAAGEPFATFRYLAAESRRIYAAQVSAAVSTVLDGGGFDVVIAGCDPPKDVNLYFASSAATRVALAKRPVVRSGGVVIVPTLAPEGIGIGAGEARFGEILRTATTPDAILRLAVSLEARGQTLGGGGQRALLLAKTLQRCRVVFAGAADPAAVGAIGCGWQPDVQTALDAALAALPAGTPPRVAIVPHALLTLFD